MNFLNYIVSLMILSTMGILYKRYQQKYELDEELKGNDLVNKYLLNDEMIYGKPNMWIHIDYVDNARSWKDFKSRRSRELNKDYINICIESIIKYNSDNFNIFIINDDSFRKLLDNFDVNINNVPEPIKSNVRKLGISRLLYKYGGISVSKSFLSMKNLISLYKEGIRENKMFCVENVNKTPSNFEKSFLADDIIMGCNKFCEEMNKYGMYINEIIKSDYTSESKFLGSCRNWLHEKYKTYHINMLNGRLIGVKNVHNKYVELEKLLGVSELELDSEKVGIYIDEERLDKRKKLNWFNKLGKNDIFRSDTQLGNHMLLSHGNGMNF